MAEEVKEISKSNLQKYIRLQYLINTTTSGMLRDQFRAKWKAQYQSEWENLTEDGAKFVNGPGQSFYKRSGLVQKKILELGDLQKWDIILLVDALECLEKGFRAKMEPVKKIRNTISHLGSMELENTEFEDMWNTISEVLVAYGVSEEEILEAKKIGLGINQDQDQDGTKLEQHLNQANITRAEELKNNGNDLYRKEKYKPAIFMFTEALKLPGISSNNIAVLYSNRSIALLKSGDFESAREDAKGAVQLRPSWWRGYHRLASAYRELKKYPEALKYFNIAHCLEPTNAQVKDDRDHCRHLLEKRNRSEHTNPIHFTESFEESAELMNKTYGTNTSACELQRSNRLSSMAGMPLGLCGLGHNYRHARGVKQDYKKAFEYYAQAAKQGSAEGLYNMAELTKEGLGTTRSMSESIRLLKLAAEQEPMTTIFGITMPNLGVKEAEHSLGLSYQNGVGVDQDIEMAKYWYERAIRNSSGCSANNLALMYDSRSGFAPDFEKAVQYWKIGAWLKAVRATENLAKAYLRRFDRKNAQKFYAYGISLGSVSLRMEYLDAFKAMLGKDLDTPLNISVFEAELEEDIRRGILKHLVPVTPEHEITQNMLNHSKTVKQDFAECPTSTSFKEHGLTDPYRVAIIKGHRSDWIEISKTGHRYQANPAYLQPKPVDLIGLKPIYFQDMTTKTDKIYEGYLIKLTIIEDALLGKPSVGLIGQDENGDAQRIYVYNFKQDKETQDSLGFGCKITVVNPYYRITLDGLPALRVDDTSTLFLHPELADKKRCRYCITESGTIPCRICKRTFYCSKLCMKRDSSLLNHLEICKKRI